jgi:hypothetical protein
VSAHCDKEESKENKRQSDKIADEKKKSPMLTTLGVGVTGVLLPCYSFSNPFPSASLFYFSNSNQN